LSADRFDLTLYRALKALVWTQGGELELPREMLNNTDRLRLRIEKGHGDNFRFMTDYRDPTQGGQDENGETPGRNGRD